MNKMQTLQKEINELLDGQEHLLIPSLEAHFYAIEKDNKNGFSKDDYLNWYKEETGEIPPKLPSFIKSNKTQSWISNMIDKACNEKSMQELESEENTIRFLSFIKFILNHEIQGLQSEGKDF